LIAKDSEIHERKNNRGNEIRAFKTSSQKGFMEKPALTYDRDKIINSHTNLEVT